MSEDRLKLEDFTWEAKMIIVEAQRRADREHRALVTPPALVLMLFELAHGKAACERAGLDPEAILADARRRVAEVRSSDEPSFVSSDLLVVIKRASSHASAQGKKVDLESLCAGLAYVGAIPAALAEAAWEPAERPRSTSQKTAHMAQTATSLNGALFIYASGLRGLADKIRAALVPAEAASFERAALTLDAIERSLSQPTPVPELEVIRAAPDRLRLRRVGEGEISLSWMPTRAELVLTHAADGVQRPSRFRWVEEERRWSSPEGELFAVLQGILARLYPELD